MASLLLIPLLFLSFLGLVESTHFAYATYEFAVQKYVPYNAANPQARNYSMSHTFGYRTNFGWYSPARDPNVGDTVDPGQMFFYPLLTTSTLGLGTEFDVQLKVETKFTNDNWFLGHFNHLFITKSPYHGNHWRSYFNDCCRLSSIRDRNNDVDWTVTGILNKYSERSPVATGLPRVYVQQFFPLRYRVPFLSPSGKDVIVSLAIAPTDSTLNNRVPIDNNIPGKIFTLNKTTGTVTWTPQITGLYAVAFFVEEVCDKPAGSSPGDVPCADQGLVATPTKGSSGSRGVAAINCCSRVPLDFIFQVDPGCEGQANCVPPPYFYSPFNEFTVPEQDRVWYFNRGIEGFFNVCATVNVSLAINDTQQTTHINVGTRPATSSWAQVGPEALRTCYLFKWAPGIADQDQYICASAFITPGYRGQPLYNQGLYCILLIIKDGIKLQAAGIIRDFRDAHPDFNVSYSDCRWCTAANNATNLITNSWVSSRLDANHKPVYAPGTPVPTSTRGTGLQTGTAQGFYDWYTTDPATTNPRNLAIPYTVILSSGASLDEAVFTFLSSTFFPIDNQGFGNEGADHNYYYTFEVNMYITYYGSLSLRAAAMDDLWIFIDDVLPANWNQHGIKPPMSNGNPYNYTIVMDTLLDHENSPLRVNETYRCDMFYANRYGVPYLLIEVPNNTLCSQLSSGKYAINLTNFASVPLVDGSVTGAVIPADGFFYVGYSGQYGPSKGTINRPAAPYGTGALNHPGLKIFDQRSQGSAVCWGTPLKALHGFIATFTWFVDNPSKRELDGFAFMLVSYPFYRGGAAGSLGYGGLQRSLVVEFDMLQTALLSDPDFTVCCGDYPIWDTAQPGWTMKPYGQVSTHAKATPVSGSYPGNSADENPATGGLVGTSSQGRIFLDFRNGTEYKTKIIYQPALDDGSTNVQLGWLWTYINKQLEPINAVQLDGVVLRNMLGGATTFCFTSGGQWVPSGSMTGSNPSGYGADIWLLDYNVLIVPTDAGSTLITKAQIIGQPEIIGASSPISPMIAGQISTVTVQAKDACGNPITVGGELDLFTCNVVKETCPGNPVPCNGTDNGDGTYTFAFRPTIAARNYLLYLSFGPTGDVRTLRGSPYRFIVDAATASIETSIAVFGQLPELYSNAGNDPFNGDLRSEGVFAARFSQYGRVVAYKMFDFANAMDVYNGGTVSGATGLVNFINGVTSTEYLLIATSGSNFLPSLLGDASLNTALNGLSPAGNELRNVVPGNAYTLIARKGGVAPTCVPAPCQRRSTNGTARITTRGIDDSSISFTRNFTLVASSADANCGPWAILNSIFDDIRVPAGTLNQFTIQARDIFGNLNRLTNIQAAFQPDLVPSTNGDLTASPIHPLTGYFYYPFYSEKAGEFFMYASLNGDSGSNIRNGLGMAPFAPYRVLIDPGLANITNSYCQGPVLTTSTVGVWNTFQLVLYDRWSNAITFMNPADQISATLIWKHNKTVVTTLNTSWQDGPCGVKCVYYASFNTTIASSLTDDNQKFEINVTINGYWKICGQPDIVPGPFYPPTTTFDVGALAPTRAGTQTTFTIYTRDRFGNARRTQLATGDDLLVVFQYPVTGYVIQYAGQGQYAVAATPTKKGDNNVQVIASGTGSGDVKPAGNTTIGNQILKVIPGPAAANSTTSGISNGIIVRAGTLNEFIVTSYDKYLNLRDNTAYGIVVANASDYAFRFNEPVKGIEGMIRLKSTSTYATTGMFNFEYNATIIGTYRITVQTTPAPGAPVSQHILASPITPVYVVPACTHPPSTVFGGAGLAGGIQATETNFTMTARDIFTNIQADWRDQNLYNVTITPATTPAPNITNQATPGNFLVKYTIPNNDGTVSPNIAFTIKVCHNGLNSTTGPKCYDSWCTTFNSTSVSTNRVFNGTITVTDGFAGTPMNWFIRDIDSNGNAATGQNIVTSWLVTVTRTTPNDGVPASVAQPISIAGTEMITGPPAMVRTNVSFTPTLNIGTFRVRVFAYGIETEQSKAGISVNIGPGPVYPPNCVVSGLSATVPAGSDNAFAVALKDEWFHDITDGGLTVNANLTHSDAGVPMIPISGVHNSSNWWTFDYHINVKGLWDVSIGETVSLMAGKGPIGNNLKITVTPGIAVCDKSYVKGVTVAPAMFATAGESVTFTIVPVDTFGNPVEDASTLFTLADVNGDADFAQAAVSSAVPPAIEIQVTYLPRKVLLPNNVLSVRIGGCELTGTVPVAGSGDTPQQTTLAVVVWPADIYPPNSQAIATVSRVEAGNELGLNLTLRDRFNNAWFSGRTQAITGFVGVPGASQPYAAITSDGAGAGKYVLTLSGQNTRQASAWDSATQSYIPDYVWEVTANGVTISGPSPLLTVPNSVVTAGPTSPSNTLPPTLVDLTSDVPQVYQVTLRDVYGNIKYQNATGDQVKFNWIQGTVLCSFNEAVSPANDSAITTVGNPVYDKDGVFNVTVLGTIVGSYTLNITVKPQYGPNGVAYVGEGGWYGSPNCGPTARLLETVNPGPASPPHSWWTINKKVFNAGEKAIIFVQARDRQFNNIGKGNTPLSIGNKTVPASPSVMLPAVGPELSTLGGYTITPRTDAMHPWIDPIFCVTNCDPTFPIAPGSIPPSGTVTDFGNSSYAFEITFWKSGNALPVVVGMLNASAPGVWVAVPWPSTLASDASVDVLPGPPQQFYPDTAGVATLLQNAGTTAAVPTSFTIYAYDKYGNPVAPDSNATFDIVMRQQVNGYEVPITATVIGGGATTFSFTSAWAGPFDLLITLHPGDGSNDITPPPAVVTIDHATCEADNPGKPYRCPDRSCVASYNLCPTTSIPAGTCGLMNPPKVTCSDGITCRDKATDCPCPGNQFRCVTGNCAPTQADCPQPNTCPSGYSLCPGTGQCRQDITKDCPSAGACPPGYVVCPSGVNCARNMSDCPVIDTSLCPAPSKLCPTGTCAATATDCPTPTTCPASKPTLCLTDGSCQLDAAHCPDQYPCYGPNTYRCPGTGLCTTGLDQCPSSTTCKPGWVKCEAGTCAPTQADCVAPIDCGYSKVRCADGSCVDNTLFCPAVPSCALDAPIRCWDGNCVTYAVECTTPQQCTTNVTCPGGSCSNTVSLCPTGTTCPTDKPVLCPDGSCQADKDSCTIIPSCPVDQPVRCPDGQSCRGARTDCPTIISCPIGASVKCADGTCALAIDKCAPATNCPADLLRCPGGECIADTTALCPTHETCPTDYGKCLDGTCRKQCPTTYQTCPAGQVTCPQAAAGVQCALDLTACPQQPTCPPGLPVRCFDASCSSTVTNCPTPPETFPNNKIPCGDGTWATSIANCPTPLTCPSDTPAKCTDNTCRLTPADCSVPRLCPLDTPYLCSSGACVKNPWDPECTSSTAPCPLTKPVACSPYGSGVCAENITVCDGLAPSPLNCTGVSCTVCGVIDSVPQTYCRSGACVNDPAYCPTVGCDPSVPVKCTDGQCVAKSSLCNDENSGCPSGLLRCDQTGMCTETINNQIYDPTKGCPTNFTSGCPGGAAFCDDGSCPYQGVCPKRNGCAAYGMDQTKTKRCYDGTCVVNIADCTSNAPPEEIPQIYPGMCQPSNPYKCADGFCAKTSTACPPQLVNLDCKAPNTVQCATGACVSSALMCPPLNPVCPDGYVRCPSDASCRAHIETCPVYSKCPHRCDNGVCAPDATYCSFDEFTGCPGGMDKCTETGECVQNLASCTPINKANGCPSTLPFKCPNGDCKALQSQCNVGPSGACPQSAPLLCADGECATLCTGGSTCPGAKPQRCADGTCAVNLAECHTYNGCNGTHPYRCVDGSCASQAATAQDPESCPLTVLCSAGLQLCMDGGCVAKASLCTPLLCVPPLEYCNFGCNMNCSTQTPKCPSKSPILCPSGACVASLALCGTSSTGGAANTDCTGSTPLACAQGNCVANLNECPALAAGANGVPLNGAAQGQNANAGCGTGKVMCSNGECVAWARRYACKIIASCPPLTYRWWDGSCRASKSGAPAEVDCANPDSSIRCEDGWCRDEKMGYDGCSNNKKASFLCSNRNCAENPSKCNWVASGNPSTYPRFDTSCKFGACRRLLQSSTRPDPCIPDATKQCNAMIHAGGAAELIEATVDIYKTTTIPVALNKDLVSIASLSIPSGAFYLTNGASTTSISIRAVPASRLRYAVNEIVPSRRSQYGSYLDFPITVLSVPFECVLPEEVQKDFVLNITYTAWIDLTPPMIDYKDVCLARLVELQGFSTWECLIGDRSLRNVSSIYYVHKEGAPSQEVASVFQTCSPSSAPGVVSPYNGSVYAFIFSPVPDAPKSPEGLDVVQRNIVWIILGILLGIALLILLTYCAFRLFRYREKYHTEREEADRLQEEVENMKQFGGDSGNKDDQVAMTANPLAVQLKDVQARYNEEEMKLQQAEASLRKQEGEIRAQHIDNMRDNRNKLAQELEKLKAQLAEAQAASQPKATYEEHEGPSYTGDEPVREEFDTGSTAVAPKRGKKDL